MAGMGNGDTASADPVGLAARAAAQIHERSGIDRFDVALVLGSGWGAAADHLGETITTIPATELAGFSAPAPAGHHGTVRCVRTAAGRHLLVLGARTHLYENRGPHAVAHPLRTAAAAGATIAVLTNGAGGIEAAWPVGTAVLISDHINLTGASPLEGARFVDLTDLYSARLRALARSIAPDLPEGVYCQFRGPQYETPAEIRAARILGADLVGMSTALEAIAARDAGMEVLGISLVTNPAAGVTSDPLSHAEVLDAGRTAEPTLTALLTRIVSKL